MKMLMTWAVLLSAIVAVRAEELYDLRGPAPDKKYIMRTETKEKMNDAKLTIKFGEKTINATTSTTSERIREREFLAIDGRNVTKCLTRVIKDEREETSNLGGMRKTEKKNGPLSGQVVISEKGKDGWKHRLDDEKPTEEQAERLETFSSPINGDVLYPKDKVKVGHQWEVTEKMLSEILKDQGKVLSGKGKATFVKVEDYNNEQCFVAEFDIEFKVEMKSTKTKGTLEFKGKIVEHTSLKTGITMKEVTEGTMKLDGRFKKEDGDDEIGVLQEGRISETATTTVKEKK